MKRNFLTDVRDFDETRQSLQSILTATIPNVWESYEVTWNASVGSTSVGSGGSLTGYFIRNEFMCLVSIKLILGTSFSFGTGAAFSTFSLPKALKVGVDVVGPVRAAAAVDNYSGNATITAGGSVIIPFFSGGAMTKDVPATWIATNTLQMSVWYPV